MDTDVQLAGQLVYERQKALRSQQRFPPAPRIVAINLHIPSNLGSVLRLADAAGSSGVTFIGNADLDRKRIHKAARSADRLVAWDVYTLEQFIDEANLFQPLIALEITSTSRSIFAECMPNECTVVIGNERHGIPAEILALCRQALHIPMYGTNGSMNVTHALGIALFEWRRQQGHCE